MNAPISAENTHPLVLAMLAKPKTHAVVTTYDDGTTRRFETQSERQAENHAVMDRRNIGRPLIRRDTGKTVRIVSVDVVKIA